MDLTDTLPGAITDATDDSDAAMSFTDWFRRLTPATRAGLRDAKARQVEAASRHQGDGIKEPLAGSTAAHPDLLALLGRLADALNRISTPATVQAPTQEALSKQEAAKFLGVPVKTVEYLIRARKVRYVQLGSQRGRVIPVEALRQLLRDNTQLTAQEELRRRARR